MRILVASMPRCGSTLLLRAIGGYCPGPYLPNDSACGGVHDWDAIPDVPFLKTHLSAPASLPADILTIFIFGDPLRAVVSTAERRFDRKHFAHCGWTSDDLPDVWNRDDLGYERIFDSWTKPHDFPVLLLRYETLWENINAVEDYIGRRIVLPRQVQRNTYVSREQRALLVPVYGRLVDKVMDMSDMTMLRKRRDDQPGDGRRVEHVGVLSFLFVHKPHPGCSFWRVMAIAAANICKTLELEWLYWSVQSLHCRLGRLWSCVVKRRSNPSRSKKGRGDVTKAQ
ncbi:MAG: hypothetical protein K9N51_04205 [Candidatus Pacebacteria bacterium]|nr:hypothetical protein [Candidatus Paceibacterota bacterium]